MKKLATLCFLFLGLTNCATTGGLKIPEIEQRTTRNGMKVYILEDHRAPIYMQQFWVQVGSANEHDAAAHEAWGTTGLSHFFEHLMFRGTKQVPDYFKAVARMGGELNAFTWLDETVYWEKLPSRFLQQAIAMEGDRFRNIKMDFLNLEPEREVVRSERLLRTDNSPSGRLDERLTYSFFRKSSYRWPTVGWMSDLIAIPQSTVEEYFKTHYMPNNSFALFVGDVSADEVMSLLEEHMGELEPAEAPPEAELKEDLATAESHVPVMGAVKSPTLQLVYPTPSPASDEWAIFEVLNAVLTQGRSSRLNQRLVYGDTPVANSVNAFLFPMRGPSPYSISVQGRPDAHGAEIIDLIQSELDRLAKEGPTEQELVRAVRGLRSKVIRHMQSVYGRAQTMGFWIRATGNPILPFEHLKSFGSVSAEDVQRVATKYLAQTRRTTGSVINPEWLRKAILDLRPEESISDKAVKTAYSKCLEALTIYERVQSLQAEIDMEAKAIQLLHERAAVARSQYTESGQTEKLAELDRYMKEADKGTEKRRQELGVLHQGLTELQTAGAKALNEAKQARTAITKIMSPEDVLLDFLLLAATGSHPQPPILDLGGTELQDLNVGRALAIGYALSISRSQKLFEGWFGQQKGSTTLCSDLSTSTEIRRGCDLLRQLKPIAMESRWEVQR
jgi:zinc protease